MRIALVAAAMLTVLQPPVAFALSEMECADLFRKADADHDGAVAGAEATRYLVAMRTRPVPLPADGTLDYPAFMRQCRDGVFRQVINDPDAPLKGANSFTEAQARYRGQARGFVDVSALKKDDSGIWRGSASMDGAEFSLAVDYRGNVVSEPG
mgnify:CR=1 FL=1